MPKQTVSLHLSCRHKTLLVFLLSSFQSSCFQSCFPAKHGAGALHSLFIGQTAHTEGAVTSLSTRVMMHSSTTYFSSSLMSSFITHTAPLNKTYACRPDHWPSGGHVSLGHVTRAPYYDWLFVSVHNHTVVNRSKYPTLTIWSKNVSWLFFPKQKLLSLIVLCRPPSPELIVVFDAFMASCRRVCESNVLTNRWHTHTHT